MPNHTLPRLILAAVLLAAVGVAAADTYAGPYRAAVTRVIDGDTVEARVRLWPGIEYAGPVRLSGVDAPELHARRPCERQAAQRARDYVAALLGGAGVITLRAVSVDKYGRPLARITVDGDDLTARLIATGHGRAYSGGKRGAWCQ